MNRGRKGRRKRKGEQVRGKGIGKKWENSIGITGPSVLQSILQKGCSHFPSRRPFLRMGGNGV